MLSVNMQRIHLPSLNLERYLLHVMICDRRTEDKLNMDQNIHKSAKHKVKIRQGDQES